MSTAFYRPSIAPRLIGSFPRLSIGSRLAAAEIGGGREHIVAPSIEVWNTTCVVTNFGRDKLPLSKDAVGGVGAGRDGADAGAGGVGGCRILINPANPQLSGVSKFPYFPRGGPVPKEYPTKDAHHIMGYVTQWGGMEVGEGILIAFNVVDGIVHHLGGWSLAMEIKLLPVLRVQDERCPVGRAVSTSAGWKSELSDEYDRIVHTVPPFYRHHHHHHHNHHHRDDDDDGGGIDPDLALALCYRNALSISFREAAAVATAAKKKKKKPSDGSVRDDNVVRVASPLLGAGCRGFPLDVAVQIAAREAVRWREGDESVERGGILAFGIPDRAVAESLVSELERVGKEHCA